MCSQHIYIYISMFWTYLFNTYPEIWFVYFMSKLCKHLFIMNIIMIYLYQYVYKIMQFSSQLRQYKVWWIEHFLYITFWELIIYLLINFRKVFPSQFCKDKNGHNDWWNFGMWCAKSAFSDEGKVTHFLMHVKLRILWCM